MAEMNIKQIIDRLNAEFTGDTRKLVFWYDDNGEFVEDMQTVTLDNAKVYFLQPDNQFATKFFLERQDTTTNYLIYAPFPKPDVRDNHLEDTMLYSKRFFADRASLLSVDLGIDEKYKSIIEKHIKFFASKDRTQRFYDLEIENFNEENIITGLLSAICRTRTCSFEEVIRVMLTDSTLEDNKFLIETEKYGLWDDFWKLCEQHFGYADVKPTLEKLVVTMFVTYTAKYVPSELPKPWKAFSSYKAGNIIAFMDNLMNNILYRSRYDELSAHVAAGLNAQIIFSDREALRRVDAITHPAVWEAIVAEARGSGAELVVVEAAVMGEEEPDIYDEKWFVWASRETRISRLMENRGYSREKSLSIMANQWPDERFKEYCGVVIDNDGSLEETGRQIAAQLLHKGQNET